MEAMTEREERGERNSSRPMGGRRRGRGRGGAEFLNGWGQRPSVRTHKAAFAFRAVHC